MTSSQIDASKINSFKLYYFNIKGRAEPIRLLFSYAQVKFEDIRIEISDWPKWKPRSEIFPWNQIPVLHVTSGGKTHIISDSIAIGQFLGSEFEICGKNEWEEAMCSELVHSVYDLRDHWKKYGREPDEEKKKSGTADWLLNIAPNYLNNFSRVLKNNNGKWLVGSSPTWADIFVASVLENLEERATSELLNNYPELKTFQQNVFLLEGIRKYLSK